MKKAVYAGAITALTGITCGALAYAAREDAPLVVLLVCLASVLSGLIATAREDA